MATGWLAESTGIGRTVTEVVAIQDPAWESRFPWSGSSVLAIPLIWLMLGNTMGELVTGAVVDDEEDASRGAAGLVLPEDNAGTCAPS